jgi:hypothetical protein
MPASSPVLSWLSITRVGAVTDLMSRRFIEQRLSELARGPAADEV